MDDQRADREGGRAIARAFVWLAIAILIPLGSFVLYNGVVKQRWGVIVALVLSTLIFVLCHPIGHGIPVTRLVGGLLFALAYEFGGSLIVPITIHTLGNLAIFTLSLIF